MPASDQRATEQKKLPGIFISYRRSDNPDAVGRIYDRLIAEFGKARVFKDVDSIPLGQDFRSHLNEIVGGCAAVLAIIGPKWTDIRNEAGQKRLDDPDDFVRIELEAALARSVPVVPVLVGHAPMPGTSQLPSTLASLAFRQSIEVRPDPDFHNDASRLVSALKAIIDPDAAQEDAAANSSRGVGATPHSTQPKRSWVPWLVGVAAATTLAAIGFAIPALKYLRETPPPETRFEISIPETNQPLSLIALSPDGRQIVFVAGVGDATRLWLRPLASTTAQPLSGTEGATSAFWSPDSRSIGFFANGALKRLDLGGGPPLTLVPTNARFGGSWNAQGVILFSWGTGMSVEQATSIARVSSTGGAVSELNLPGAKIQSHFQPTFLPDGRRFLFGSVGGPAPGIYLGSLDGNATVRLTTEDGPFSYLPSGWLLLFKFNQRVLLAQRLDLEKSTLVGEPVTLSEGVGSVSAALPGFVAFRSTLVNAGERQLTWRDRAGTELGTVGDPDRTYQSPRVSPDGSHIVVSRGEQGKEDVFLLDGAHSTRLTFEGTGSGNPVWSPDGSRIAYSSPAAGERHLYQIAANGTGEAQRLSGEDENQWPTSWSQDGQFLLYMGQQRSTSRSFVGVLSLGARDSTALVDTPFREVWGQFSPDGKWVAYQSSEYGRDEIFVRPFIAPGAQGKPVAPSVRRQVSAAGGIHPCWSADGRKIFYINPQGEMMAVSIAVSGSALEAGKPIKLFQTRILNGGVDTEPGRQYDVARDGRFLINQVPDTGTAPITLIQNWNPDAGK